MFHTNLPESNSNHNGGAATRTLKKRVDFSVNKRFDNKILSRLSAEDFARIKPFLESVSLNDGVDIYKPEDKINTVYFPETAVVSQFHILEDGRTMEAAMIGRDGATGFAALFGASSADCFSQVSVAGSAIKINLEILKGEFSSGGTLQNLLLEYANRFAAQVSRAVVCSNYHSVEQRFCTWFLMLCDRRGANKINLTHSQIAAYLGVHRPSFTHIASTLRERRVIDYSRGSVKINDRCELLKHCCDCYEEIY